MEIEDGWDESLVLNNSIIDRKGNRVVFEDSYTRESIEIYDNHDNEKITKFNSIPINPSDDNDNDHDGQSEESEEMVDEVKGWIDTEKKGTIETLYDSMMDYNDEEYMKKRVGEGLEKTGSKRGKTCVCCSYCFVPHSYAYDEIEMVEEGNTKKNVCVSREYRNVIVDMNTVHEILVGENWREFKCLDSTYSDLIDIVFDVRCANCDTVVGLYYSHIKLYVYVHVVVSNG